MIKENKISNPMHQLDCSDALKATRNEKQVSKLKAKLKDGSIYSMPLWKLIKECSEMNTAQLDAVAIIDCAKEYTYREMFEEWDKYARVFSALGITDKNKSRIGIGGTLSAEPLFCLYGANMTGATISTLSYPDFLPSGKWKDMIRAEHLTDLVISDIMISTEFMEKLLKEKKKFGLRNIILVHTKLGGPTVGPAEVIFNEVNYHKLKNVKGVVFMDELIEKYKDRPIHYGRYNKNAIAIIGHTSGTTRGTRKPIPYTANGFNHRSYVETIICYEGLASCCTRQLIPFDFSHAPSLANDVHSRLIRGQTVVFTCFGFLHPKYYKAFKYYNITHTMIPGFILDVWLERNDMDDADFSALKVADGVGSYVSPERLRQYRSFFKKHGYKGSPFVNTYGMSEAGIWIVPLEKNLGPDCIGFPEPVENFMIRDEKNGKFYTVKQGERIGVLHVTAPGIACNKLDGKKLFDYVVINGRNFICTNDLVRVNKNASLSYAGRADKYFTNNEGVRFDSGLVETKFNAQAGIKTCAIIPVLEKRIHDTVPVLYIVPKKMNDKTPEVVAKAIKDVYFTQKVIDKSVLPSQFVLVESVPCNSNGKVDIYRITRERLQGKAYNILPVSKNGKVCDIKIELAEQLNSIRAGGLPEGMGESSAFNIFDLFNTTK